MKVIRLGLMPKLEEKAPPALWIQCKDGIQSCHDVHRAAAFITEPEAIVATIFEARLRQLVDDVAREGPTSVAIDGIRELAAAAADLLSVFQKG